MKMNLEDVDILELEENIAVLKIHCATINKQIQQYIARQNRMLRVQSTLEDLRDAYYARQG